MSMKDDVFIIAELSANHNQKKDIALESIKAAKEAGADAVKIQTYTPDTLTLNCDNEYFQIKQGTLWDGTTLYKLYQKAYTPWEWHKELFDYAKEIYPDLTVLDGVGNIKAKISSGKFFNLDADISRIHFANKRFPNFLNS